MLIIPCCINIKSLFSSGQVVEMTSPEENSELCFPETTSMAKPRGTLKVEGKQNSMFPEGLVIKCFVIPPDSKLEENCEKNDFLNTTVAVPAVRAAVKLSFPTETTR